MEFLSANNFSLSYRRGKDNDNLDFLSRLPLPLTEENISDSCTLLDPVDLVVYFIRICGLLSSPIPGISLGGLATSLPSTSRIGLGGLIPQLDLSVLGGLPLTHDDIRTHRTLPFPPHLIESIDHPQMICTENTCISYAIRAYHEAIRSSIRDAYEVRL